MEKYKYESKFGFRKVTCSPLLQRFFIEYAAWIRAGFPKHAVFNETYFICKSLTRWIDAHDFCGHILYVEFISIRAILFNKKRLYPFAEWEGRTPGNSGIHNPARKDFVLLYGSN